MKVKLSLPVLTLSLKVYMTPMVKMADGSFPSYFYALLTCLYVVHKVVGWFFTHLAMIAFNNRISDPLVGGTYITLLNTFYNLGRTLPKSFSLWLLDQITAK